MKWYHSSLQNCFSRSESVRPCQAQVCAWLRLVSEDQSRFGTPGGAVLYLPTSMKFYYVYILHNQSKNFIYVGYSENLKQRYTSHMKGEVTSTKHYIPLGLIHYEAYRNMQDAKRREPYLK